MCCLCARQTTRAMWHTGNQYLYRFQSQHTQTHTHTHINFQPRYRSIQPRRSNAIHKICECSYMRFSVMSKPFYRMETNPVENRFSSFVQLFTDFFAVHGMNCVCVLRFFSSVTKQNLVYRTLVESFFWICTIFFLLRLLLVVHLLWGFFVCAPFHNALALNVSSPSVTFTI